MTERPEDNAQELRIRQAAAWPNSGYWPIGFVGFLVAKFCRATGVSEDLTYAFVGVSGWLGAARTIDYLERLIEARLGTRFPRRTTDTPSNAPAASDSAKVEIPSDDKKADPQ